MILELVKLILDSFRAKGRAPKTRLSVEQATQIATAEAAQHGIRNLDLVSCREVEGAMVWIFSEGGRGSIFGVEVLDETGDILRAGRSGGR